MFSILNKNLEIKMRAFLNARILKSIKVFKNFEIAFLSDVTKQFKKQTYTVDDNIILVSLWNLRCRKETRAAPCTSL